MGLYSHPWASPLLVAALLCGSGCAGSGLRPIPSPSEGVTLSIDWRVPLVDNGLFPYELNQLGQIAFDDTGRRGFVGTADGRLVAFQTHSGEVLWEHELGEPVDGMPVVRGGDLYLGTGDGHFYAMDAAGGGVRWSYQAGGTLDSRAALTDDLVIFGDTDGNIIALERDSGELVWSSAEDDVQLRLTRGLHPPVKGQASPLVLGGLVYAGFPSGRIKAIHVDSGRVEWTADLAVGEDRHTDCDEPPVLLDGQHIAGISFSGGLHSIDLDEGEISWELPIRGATRPVVHGDHLLTTSVDGAFYVVDRSTGAVFFSLELTQRSPGRISVIGDYALVPTTEGGLYVLDTRTPYIHALFDPGSGGFASVNVASGGQIVAFDHYGVLYGLTLRYQ